MGSKTRPSFYEVCQTWRLLVCGLLRIVKEVALQDSPPSPGGNGTQPQGIIIIPASSCFYLSATTKTTGWLGVKPKSQVASSNNSFSHPGRCTSNMKNGALSSARVKWSLRSQNIFRIFQAQPQSGMPGELNCHRASTTRVKSLIWYPD